MYGFTLAISCSVKTSNIPSKFVKYIDDPLFKAVTHPKGSLTTSKLHKLYSKINTISKARRSTHPKTTPLVCSIIFPDDKLKNGGKMGAR